MFLPVKVGCRESEPLWGTVSQMSNSSCHNVPSPRVLQGHGYTKVNAKVTDLN